MTRNESQEEGLNQEEIRRKYVIVGKDTYERLFHSSFLLVLLQYSRFRDNGKGHNILDPKINILTFIAS